MAPERRPLGRRAATGALWAALSVGAGKLLALVGLAVLARLLSPTDFGLMAFALVFITYVETMGDFGTGAALIYWPDRQRDAAQVTFLVNCVAGMAWFLLTWLAAPLVAAFFQSPEGTWILRTMALVFPIKYAASAHDALLQRQIRFRTRAAAEVGFSLVKFGVAIALAYRGHGVWSLVWGQLAGQAASSATLWALVPWRPEARIPRDLLAPMLHYGRGLVAVNVLAAVVHHADLVVVGRMLGASALGLYQIAAKIPEATITVLIWVAGRVLFPTFSRIHAEGGALRQPYLQALRWVSLLTLPAAVGLAALARPVVLTVFGPSWAGAAPVLQALAVWAAVRSLGTHAGDVLKGTGRSGLLAALGGVKAAVLVPALVAAGSSGVATVAWTLAGITVFTSGLNVVVVCRLHAIRVADVVGALRPGVLAGGALAAFLGGWLRWVSPADDPATLAITVLSGAGIYLLALRLVGGGIYRQAWQQLVPARHEATCVGEGR